MIFGAADTFRAHAPTVLLSSSIDLYMSFWFPAGTPLRGSRCDFNSLIVIESETLTANLSFLKATVIWDDDDDAIQCQAMD